ncbi:MAG TPA: nitroreductase family protein, partial [Bacteroidales bacterium]|nr:nitroreductase family protein [Bacteroidales bacterium]
MAICPVDAIKVEGRGISPNDLFNVLDNQISYNSLLTTLQSRRSIREFTDEPVSTEIVEKIVDAARTAPMGIPPSEVHLLVLHGREKVNTFTAAYCEYLKSIRWMVSPWFLTIMRPVWGKKNDELFRNFVKPLINNYINFMNSGQNLVTYDAPLAIYFYGSPY